MPSRYTALENRQAALINIIFSGIQPYTPQALTVEDKGIRIYQNNLLVTATNALSLNYPVIEQMIGSETMRRLTRHLLEMELPSSGDWADFGKQLPQLIKKTPLHQAHPYLETMAILEWNLKQAAISATTTLDVVSLSRLSESDLSRVYLHFGAGINLIKSPFKVDELWRLHHTKDGETSDIAAQIYEILNQTAGPYYFITYQKDHLPCIKSITKETYQWCSSVMQGYSLAELFEQQATFDFSQWISNAIEQQWLRRLSESPSKQYL